MAGFFTDSSRVTSTGEGIHHAEIPPGWDIGGNVNGGFLFATAARAMADVVGRPDPVSVTAHFLSPGRAGEAEILTEPVRIGRRFATARATMATAGRPTIAMLGTFGTLEPDPDSPLMVRGAPPELPAPEQCAHLAPTAPGSPPFIGRVEVRFHPDDAGFFRGTPTGTPSMRGWFRLADNEPIDTIGLLLAVDAFPPTVFNSGLLGWAPTLELTAHVRARPAPGWLACRFDTRFITNGMLEVDGEVWDSTDTLVAQSRQIALLPRGD